MIDPQLGDYLAAVRYIDERFFIDGAHRVRHELSVRFGGNPGPYRPPKRRHGDRRLKAARAFVAKYREEKRVTSVMEMLAKEWP